MTARRQPEPLSDLAGGALRELTRGLWHYRLELLFLAVLAGLWWLLRGPLGAIPAAVVILAAAALLVASASLRRPALLQPFRTARVRRALLHALEPTDGTPARRLLSVQSVRGVPAGDVASVRVVRGRTVAEVEGQAERLAAAMRLHDVRVTRDRADASRATVLLMRRDPFEAAAPITWPRINAVCASDNPSRHPGRGERPEALRTPDSKSLLRRKSIRRAKSGDPESKDENGPDISLWDPIPLGVDELGNTITVSLPGRNILIGGEPGSGKSVSLSMLVAAAALDPTAGLWLLDGKSGVELGAWAPAANAFAYTTPEAIDVLAKLQAGIDDRYRWLKSKGLRKVDTDTHLHLLVVDELAFFCADTTRPREKAPPLGEEFAERLRDVVARGRAAGVITVLSTQKPSGDTIPTALRDLVGIRFALRCNTRDASDTVLGRGYAAVGADASTIPAGQRGVGYLLDESTPQRIKTFYLADDDVLAIAEHATGLRIDTEQGHALQPTT